MTTITLNVTLDAPQRQAVMAQVRSRYPETAGTTQAINAGGIFRIQAIRGGTLPADLTTDAVRSIVFEVVAEAQAADLPQTRNYSRDWNRTIKPYRMGRKH